MPDQQRTLGLRSRVVVSFGVLSLLVALVVSLTAYAFARSYLLSQRESTALTRALLDARAVAASLRAGTPPGDALAAVPAVGQSQALVRVYGTWYTAGVTVSPDDLPDSLLAEAERVGAAQQRFAVEGHPVFAVAVSAGDDLYLEIFQLDDLDLALRLAGWLMAGLSVVAFGVGALLGRSAVGRLMRPLNSLSQGAQRVAEGDLTVRLAATGDPDLAPISSAFNEMADAVEARIARERRFAANVGHELRSPVTTILGTAELLDRNRAQLSTRDGRLVQGLVGQARRLSQTLVDLLELGGTGARSPVQVEAVDLGGLIRTLLEVRGDEPGLLRGDDAVVRTDARRVERVLTNLLDNGDRHGGGVTAVVVERTAVGVRVHVDDAGPGVVDGAGERIFEPFVRGPVPEERSRDGAGLGLAIATEQAAAIGGELAVSASPEGGARFTLALPMGAA